ncbi:transcription termination factor MTERF9, chloroplastic-like isoform X2 [Panicum virgatum]|uniref:Uncharacterized protein n=1 Tax=Panicum virgatum TaxID=38727 RepID=A0A8T0TP02_PANVG|nr:transcription termination factor MTERF9, chloroplastic-like isoform X2 [Panicum virgatum]XP_039843089.1 transcription termination factor MTERF9, chloroplastic-like isoform X2 [Panicum virgatum]XP_039843090.1 transcription termination factor MTERF9, chloroplastic-like isoform X2 [Panicum virgatum]KAG2610753.1 hypothetical protein PVAP13_4KG216300 [Panicum virgatum]
MLLLRRHLLPLHRAASSLPSPIYHRAWLLSTSASASASASTAPFSLEDYLVAACGLHPAQALKTAKKALDEASKQGNKKAFEDLCWSRLKSASNPDAILALLSGVGLSSADIAEVVVADPLILRASPKNVGPRLHALRDRLGLPTPQIARFLVVGSRALRSCDVGPKLEFFISFFGSFEHIFAIIKKSDRILHSDVGSVINPNIALLRQWGLSVRDIAQLCSHNSWVLTYSLERVKELLLRAEELGVPRSSRSFKFAVLAVSNITKEKATSKLKFLNSTLGCSESEVAIAVSKMPSILPLSEELLLRKIQFLINEVGMKPQHIVERPALLAHSLEKRLVPRHCVMKVLQAKGLLSSKVGLFTLAQIGEETFKLKYIDCHKDSVPGLADAYAAASAGVLNSSFCGRTTSDL